MTTLTICSPVQWGNGRRAERAAIALCYGQHRGNIQGGIPQGVGRRGYPAGNPNQEEIDRVDPAQ